MSLFNYLILIMTCPRCDTKAEMEAEFRFGLRELTRYRVGDRLRWDGAGVKNPPTRPEKGKYDGKAYVVCPYCNRDFWLNVSVRNDVILEVTINQTKQPYISNE